MASKLEYLKKYASDADGGDSKKKRKKEKKAREGTTMQIKDASLILPKPRERQNDNRKVGRRRGDLGFGGAMAEEVDDDLVYVDEQEVVARSRADAETSGVGWNITQHGRRRKNVAKADRDTSPWKAPNARVRHDSDDLSTPRPVKVESVDEKPGGKANTLDCGGDSDLSPPAASKGARDADDDLSPPRAAKSARTSPKAAADDSDLSPPRPSKIKPSGGKGGDSDLSPPRASNSKGKRVRHDSDDDLSFSRTGKTRSTRPVRHDSEDDLSPPRSAKRKTVADEADSDLSPPRPAASGPAKGKARHDSDADLSPTRPCGKKHGRQDSADSDLSPPRQNIKSGQRQKKRHDSDSDLSPPRAQAPKELQKKRHDSDSDLSPPRTQKANEQDEPQKMTSGLRAGLVKGSDLKQEAAEAKSKRRAEVLAADDEEVGRNATTVYRSKEGARITRAEWVQSQSKKKKKLSDYPEQELEWGGGLKQRAHKESEMAEVERIASQPFARFSPDEKYIEELKEKQDWNDPMRQHNEEKEKREAVLQEKVKPKCPHTPWINRFGILPGYRWDGKIRGNGYETRWLQKKNGRELNQREKWKYEMEEM